MYKYYKFKSQILKDCNWYPYTFIEYHKSEEMEYYNVFFQNTHLLKMDILDNYKCFIFHSREILEIQKSQNIKLDSCLVEYQDTTIKIPFEYSLYSDKHTIVNDIIGLNTYNPIINTIFSSLEYIIRDIINFHINNDVESVSFNLRYI